MKPLSLLLSLISFVLSFWILRHFWNEDRFLFSPLCTFVGEQIFLPQEKVQPWVKSCSELDLMNKDSHPFSAYLQAMQNKMDELSVSHLGIYAPQETLQYWSEKKTTTGIEAEFINSELVVTTVYKNSAAEKAGVQVGDQVVALNRLHPSEYSVRNQAGDYLLERNGKERIVSIEPTELEINEAPRYQRISESVLVLHIPSFRGEYFNNNFEWLNGIKKDDLLILDLRKNLGGNFVAGLRFLSLFLCKEVVIGSIVRPRFSDRPLQKMMDQIDDQVQLEKLNQSSKIVLSTFATESCLKNSVRILVNSQTSSVAEMVAQALKDFREAPILGSPTAGKLLVGVWYPWEAWGKGVNVSIPEAVYVTSKGKMIEAEGVDIDRQLDYRREDFLQGKDSWIRQSLSTKN